MVERNERQPGEPLAPDFFEISNLLIPRNLELAREDIERRYPGILGENTAEQLLQDPDIQRAIDESVEAEMGLQDGQ